VAWSAAFWLLQSTPASLAGVLAGVLLLIACRDRGALPGIRASIAIGVVLLAVMTIVDLRRRALEATDLGRIAVTTFLEGCIGETVAAVEARELAASACDAGIAETLRIIADDEARHSALAWRFLRWALSRGGPRLARQLDAALTRELEAAAASCTGTHTTDDSASSHGMLSAPARLALRSDVLREIVAPCLGALTRGQPTGAVAASG